MNDDNRAATGTRTGDPGEWATGPRHAPVTVIEYGDYECPDVVRAEPMARDLRNGLAARVRFVFRHFPLTEKHPHAFLAAEAAAGAGAQGAYWAMHETLLAHPDALELADLLGYAGALGLDLAAFDAALRERRFASEVAAAQTRAGRRGIARTPTFVVNGVPYDDSRDPAEIRRAIDAALLTPTHGWFGRQPHRPRLPVRTD